MPNFVADEERRKYTSLYREALTSNSLNYQFLCFYKIIEGLRERRQRLRKQVALEAKGRGDEPPKYPEERIPTERAAQVEWLNALYPLTRQWDEMALDSVFISEVIGRKITNLIHKGEELHEMRGKIAHAVLESGEPTFSIDAGLHIDEINKWLPLVKCIARYLLKEAFPESFISS
jgi:hypothetical protein